MDQLIPPPTRAEYYTSVVPDYILNGHMLARLTDKLDPIADSMASLPKARGEPVWETLLPVLLVLGRNRGQFVPLHLDSMMALPTDEGRMMTNDDDEGDFVLVKDNFYKNYWEHAQRCERRYNMIIYMLEAMESASNTWQDGQMESVEDAEDKMEQSFHRAKFKIVTLSKDPQVAQWLHDMNLVMGRLVDVVNTCNRITEALANGECFAGMMRAMGDRFQRNVPTMRAARQRIRARDFLADMYAVTESQDELDYAAFRGRGGYEDFVMRMKIPGPWTSYPLSYHEWETLVNAWSNQMREDLDALPVTLADHAYFMMVRLRYVMLLRLLRYEITEHALTLPVWRSLIELRERNGIYPPNEGMDAVLAAAVEDDLPPDMQRLLEPPEAPAVVELEWDD